MSDIVIDEKIGQWIQEHKSALLEDIAGFVNIPSVASYDPSSPYPFGERCAEAIQYVLNLGQRFGFQTINREYYCAEISLGDAAKRSVGIWGHADVVPAGEGWIYPPFACTVRDDFLIGRGVQDNKGAVIAVLYALRFIKELGIPLNYHLRHMIGSGEEIGMHDVAYYRKHYTTPDFNIVADSGFPVCYGEKGMLSVTLGCDLSDPSILRMQGGEASNSVPGYAELVVSRDGDATAKLSALPASIPYSESEETIILSAVGKAGHAAFPEGTQNAIAVLLEPLLHGAWFGEPARKQLERIYEICKYHDGRALGIQCEDTISGALTCIGTKLQGQEGRLELELNIRYPIQQSSEILLKQLEKSGFTLSHVHVSEPNYYNPDTPEVGRLTNVYRDVTGEQAEPFVMGGGTYARKLSHAVGFGPGLPTDLSPLQLPQGHGHIHGPDEVQSIPNLLTALKIYIKALLELNELYQSADYAS
ncbi:Sapep family Mn(2+)-dependent dipeptidase [Paenibacillus paeoniae]|uniref:M20/M25/M40 family metallo-hydrolase n=1 Tax=Paenibacillus paeoniae TaxID=2292705 RepID=A0A371PGT4_9BACL|nr:Sapep family Mn(2+)-dependent dipeptidase [Paenibacillus paeoniae]REK75161.1 M20/M25/M40 family metallo-hydrolase [Paenibacillus paeoniae]